MSTLGVSGASSPNGATGVGREEENKTVGGSVPERNYDDMGNLAKEHPEIQKMLEETVFNDIRKQDEKHKKRLKEIQRNE